ncbi:response regulator [Rubritalea spongiae]|uniref:Response regulator n=1 Tax=Rubritalea spongiae TaxID=430797 RepID=A0ABW5DXQ3_9BACT
MSNSSLKVMVIEDNSVYRQAIASSLNKNSEFTCIAEAASSDEAFLIFDKKQIQPEIILLDLEMPGIHGLDAIQRLLELSPKSRIIILTQSDREAHILQAITHGASGYLLKTATRNEILESIKNVQSGGATIDPKLAHITLNLIRRIQTNTPKDSDHQKLTSRELEVLQMLSDGLVKKEIADRLELSPHGVDKRMRRIYNKLQVKNVAAAVATALRKGWI